MNHLRSNIAAITLFIEDLARAKQFYLDVFDLPIHFEDADSVVFKFGTTLINLLKASEAPELVTPAAVADPSAGVRQLFTIDVDDVDAACADLKARGVIITNGPVDRPWGVRTATFADPSGHIWEIAH